MSVRDKMARFQVSTTPDASVPDALKVGDCITWAHADCGEYLAMAEGGDMLPREF